MHWQRHSLELNSPRQQRHLQHLQQQARTAHSFAATGRKQQARTAAGTKAHASVRKATELRTPAVSKPNDAASSKAHAGVCKGVSVGVAAHGAAKPKPAKQKQVEGVHITTGCNDYSAA
jgi:hypothetical protein